MKKFFLLPLLFSLLCFGQSIDNSQLDSFLKKHLKALEQSYGKQMPIETLAAMISSMDQGIGRILEALKANGIDDKTLVWFFSDNGGVASVRN